MSKALYETIVGFFRLTELTVIKHRITGSVLFSVPYLDSEM